MFDADDVDFGAGYDASFESGDDNDHSTHMAIADTTSLTGVSPVDSVFAMAAMPQQIVQAQVRVVRALQEGVLSSMRFWNRFW